MSDNKHRLGKLAAELNVGVTTIVDFLKKKGVSFDVSPNPNTKVSQESYDLLVKEFSTDYNMKKQSEKLTLKKNKDKKESLSLDDVKPSEKEDIFEKEEVLHIKDSNSKKEDIDFQRKNTYKVVGKMDLDSLNRKKEVESEDVEDNHYSNESEDSQDINKTTTPLEKKEGEIKVIGKIDLDALNQKTRPLKKTRKQKEDERKERRKSDFPEKVEKTEKTVKKVLFRKDEEQRNQTDSVVPVQKTENIDKQQESENDENFIEVKVQRLTGPTVIGRMELPSENIKKKPVASSTDNKKLKKRKKRKRILKPGEEQNPSQNQGQNQNPSQNQQQPPQQRTQTHQLVRQSQLPQNQPQDPNKPRTEGSGLKLSKKLKPSTTKVKKIIKKVVDEEDVQKQIKETLARLTAGKQKGKGAKYRKSKRDVFSKKQQEEQEQLEKDKKIIKVTEFVSVNELANMMDVPVTEVISVCMNLGLYVAINQRLDAETISLVADEFGYEVDFISVEVQEAIKEEEDKPEDLKPRAPIVTVMGHVDHGKTSLLDYVRKTNVIAGEAGGITQHIGAYHVTLEDGRDITFLDTPGHEAFTAMRARGAQVTDIAIIVVSADDSVMPQTIEAINHAHAAGVPIVFAINKIDKPGANADRIREQLSAMGFLVEEWGGKYQSQEISAKFGNNVDALLEKVLIEAEMLELKANPNKRANGTVIESSLDKGRGYITTILVENGTLKNGDIVLAGTFTGRIKAMYNERSKKVTKVGPAEPVLILGLNGAPQAGDTFHVMESEREARDIANKRSQLQREQGLRAKKHITLDEIGRRIAIGNFQELNVIVKGDVDGSIEALSDSLIRLSTEQIQVNVIHKAVGQIIETDVTLAAASNAIIIGFQVRPSIGARKIAEKEGIDIRLYSIIYDAIDEIKDAMRGMLAPIIKEEILGTAEVREVFKISKVGTVAGCMVRDGKVARSSKIRVIREGIVVFTGELSSLKRFKDDVKEVRNGMDCGLSIERFNDINVNDVIEAFHQVEVEQVLL